MTDVLQEELTSAKKEEGRKRKAKRMKRYRLHFDLEMLGEVPRVEEVPVEKEEEENVGDSEGPEKKRRKKRRAKEDEYDSEDSFIDDEELYDEYMDIQESRAKKTKHGDFFVNVGKIDVEKVEENIDVESDFIPRKKAKLQMSTPDDIALHEVLEDVVSDIDEDGDAGPKKGGEEGSTPTKTRKAPAIPDKSILPQVILDMLLVLDQLMDTARKTGVISATDELTRFNNPVLPKIREVDQLLLKVFKQKSICDMRQLRGLWGELGRILQVPKSVILGRMSLLQRGEANVRKKAVEGAATPAKRETVEDLFMTFKIDVDGSRYNTKDGKDQFLWKPRTKQSFFKLVRETKRDCLRRRKEGESVNEQEAVNDLLLRCVGCFRENTMTVHRLEIHYQRLKAENAEAKGRSLSQSQEDIE